MDSAGCNSSFANLELDSCNFFLVPGGTNLGQPYTVKAFSFGIQGTGDIAVTAGSLQQTVCFYQRLFSM